MSREFIFKMANETCFDHAYGYLLYNGPEKFEGSEDDFWKLVNEMNLIREHFDFD